jgi:3-phenylpropionate/trans-cinnamate dioxygenase ferredoxin subunit
VIQFPSRVASITSAGSMESQTSEAESAAGLLDGGPAGRLLSEGRALVYVGETEVLVVRTRRGISAVENRCPHLGRDLSDAVVSGRKLICRGHSRGYDLGSGNPTGRLVPCEPALRMFDVALIDDRLWLSPRNAT